MSSPSVVWIRGKSARDKYVAQFYRNLGAKVRVGADCAGTSDLLVLNELVIEIYFDPKFKKMWDVISEKATTAKAYDQAKFYAILDNMPGPIYVVVNWNASVAAEIVSRTK